MPQFLRKRRVGLPAVKELVDSLGIERPHLFVLLFLRVVTGSYGGVPVSPAQVRAWDPYSTQDTHAEAFAALAGKGLVTEDAQGNLALSATGSEVVDRLHEAGRAFVAAHDPLPSEELEAVSALLGAAVEATLADPVLAPRPGSHLAGSRSLTTFGPDAPAMVCIEQAIYDLWHARDDAHMRAWRDAGLEGPAMPVFTLVWSGEAKTLPELAERLGGPGAVPQIESSLAYLVAGEYLEVDGEQVRLTPAGALVRDDIEHETDRIYFAPWPLSLEEAEWLRDHLRQLVAHLPVPPL
ncbi:MAG TPA: hypothetical protein VFG99_10225 [Chloroflexia bacterium]|nr:hypothetical protein [Chloroflexia bacterium]